MSDVLTLEYLRRALEQEPIEIATKPFLVLPKCLIEPARESFGDSVQIIEQQRVPA